MSDLNRYACTGRLVAEWLDVRHSGARYTGRLTAERY